MRPVLSRRKQLKEAPYKAGLLQGLWAYYRMQEADAVATRADASGNGHNLSSASSPYPTRVAGHVLPFASLFAGNVTPFTAGPANFDILSGFSFFGWIQPNVSTDHEGILLSFAEGTPNQVQVKYLANGDVAENLIIRVQAGYYAEPSEDVGYILDIDATEVIGEPIFVAAAVAGNLVRLCVNDNVVDLPSIIEAILPVEHGAVSDSFTMGPFIGTIETTGIYTGRLLTESNLADLYNNGDGLDLPY